MEKISKVLNILYRFRFPIGGTILVILAGSLTLTGLSGKAQNVIIENKALIYGQSVQAYGKSIFGDAEVQYSKVGEDNWTDEVPYRAGTYKARGVSKNGFGTTTYTDPVDFTISPKPLNVALSATTITYGDDISYTTEVLKERGDKIDSITFSYGEEYDQLDPFGENDNFDTKVRYDVSSVKILDVNDEDVTYCYDLNVSDLDIKIKKRNLKLVSTDTMKEYDGAPLTNENYYIADETPLAKGDQITTMTPTSITEIGSTNINSNIVIKNGEKDRTSFYKITWDAPGTLTIVKRQLTINTNSITRSYNGHMLSDAATNSDDKLEYTQTGLLKDLGHEIKNVVFSSQGTYKPVSGSPNAIASYDIVDSNGADVKDHYDITINPGTINISAVPLVVTYDEKERLYDFTTDPLVGDLSYEGLVTTDEFHYDIDGTHSTSEITDLPYYYTCTNVEIYNNELSLDVTDCYNISYANSQGYVHIKALPLTISSNSITATYDGTAFSKDSLEPERQLSVETDGLQDGHILSYAFDHEGSLFANGSNTFTYSVIDTATSNDVTALYKVQTVYGQLTTNKRNMSITFDSDSWVYDGSAHLADHYESTGLADGDTIEFTSDYPSVTNYTSSSISNSRDFYISRSGMSVDEYYNKDVNSGTLRIDKKELTISYTVPESKTYDGEPIVLDPSDVTISGLDTTLFTYDMSLNYGSIERWQQGGYDIEISGLYIYRIDDIYHENLLNDNFSFKYQEQKVNNPNGLKLGHVDINKRPLHISSKTLEKKYDGLALTSTSDGVAYIYEESDLLSAKGHYIEFEYGSSQTLVGTTTNAITLRVMSSYEGDVTDCYDLGSAYLTLGQLTVTENDSLVITFTNITSKTYDGNSQIPDSTRIEENLGDGDEVKISYKMHVNAGEYPLDDCFNISIKRDVNMNGSLNDSEDDVTYCYKDMTIIGGPFVINKRYLGITMKDINRGLNSGNIPDANDHCTHNAVAETDTLNLQFSSNAQEMVEEGIYPDVTYTITSKNSGEDVSMNYDVTLTKGTASLDLIDINLSLNSSTPFYYIGSPIQYGDDSIFWDSSSYYWTLVNNNCALFGLDVEIEGELKEPGTYTVTAANTDGIRVMRYNYNTGQYDEDVTAYFNLIFGSLTGTAVVKKCKITIDSTEYEKYYDGRTIFTGYDGDLASPDHHIEINNAGAQSITKPGTIYNVINDASEVVIKDAQGNDVTYLYEVIIDSSVLGQQIRTTVNAIDITVSTNSATKSFDGKVFTLSNFSGYNTVQTTYVYDGGSYMSSSERYYDQVSSGINADCYTYLYTGDTVYFKYPVFTNYHVQVTPNEVDITVLDSEGNDVTDCYNITTDFGTLTITQLIYSYDTNNNNKTYNGTSYSLTDYLNQKGADFIDFDVDNLPGNLLDYIDEKEGSPTSLYARLTAGDYDFVVGTYVVTPTFVFMYNGEDLVAMGDIVFTGGDVTCNISKRTITIETGKYGTAIVDGLRYLRASEELKISGLPDDKKDIVYVGEEEYESTKTDYAVIPDMTENKTYTASEISTYINASHIHIYRMVNGELYDVTNCYNINFIYYDIRVITM